MAEPRPKRRAPGIRRRILAYLIGFVAFIILLLWLFQIVMLDDFYKSYSMAQTSRVANVLAQNLDNENVSELAERLAVQNDMCILVLDGDGSIVVSAEGQRRCLVHKMSSTELSWWCGRAAESEKPLMEIFATQFFRDARFNASGFMGAPNFNVNDSMTGMYVTTCTLSDGTTGTMLLNVVITPVNATVNALRYQLIFITVIILVAAIALAMVISRRVTRPIVETNDAAKTLPKGEYTEPKHAGTYREISELNKTLTEAAVELKQVEHLQHELIANVSHDLRTPLTMIGGYAEVMRDIPGENTPENMQIVIDETNRLSTLVNELLDFSRMQTGSVQMVMKPFCLTESIRGPISRIAKLTEKDGYKIIFEPSEDIWCTADEKRIGQVVYNLIGNALTYTGEDRTVTISQTVKDDSVRIEVHDTGKGIAPDELPLIWNRYYRTKETHKRAIVGSGLGLNIVQEILEKHHTKYGVDSELGKGTTFWFELPVTKEPEDDPKDLPGCEKVKKLPE